MEYCHHVGFDADGAGITPRERIGKNSPDGSIAIAWPRIFGIVLRRNPASVLHVNVYGTSRVPAGIDRCEIDETRVIGRLISAQEIFRRQVRTAAIRCVLDVGVNALRVAVPDVHARAGNRRARAAVVRRNADRELQRQSVLRSGISL